MTREVADDDPVHQARAAVQTAPQPMSPEEFAAVAAWCSQVPHFTVPPHVVGRLLATIAAQAAELATWKEGPLCPRAERTAALLRVDVLTTVVADAGASLADAIEELRALQSVTATIAAAAIEMCARRASTRAKRYGDDDRVREGYELIAREMYELTPADAKTALLTMLRRARDEASAEATELVAALREYVVHHSLEHDDPECPEDDTCACETTLRLSKALDAAGTPRLSASDNRGRICALCRRPCSDASPTCPMCKACGRAYDQHQRTDGTTGELMRWVADRVWSMSKRGTDAE